MLSILAVAIAESPQLIRFLLSGTVFFIFLFAIAITPVHEVPRRMVLAETYTCNSLETIDLNGWLCLSNILSSFLSKELFSNFQILSTYRIRTNLYYPFFQGES